MVVDTRLELISIGGLLLILIILIFAICLVFKELTRANRTLSEAQEMLRRSLEPTIDERLGILKDRTQFNKKLLSEEHFGDFKDFVYSEGEVGFAIHTLGDISEPPYPENFASREDLESLALLSDLAEKDTVKRGWIKGVGGFIRTHSMELLSKINGIASSYFGARK